MTIKTDWQAGDFIDASDFTTIDSANDFWLTNKYHYFYDATNNTFVGTGTHVLINQDINISADVQCLSVHAIITYRGTATRYVDSDILVNSVSIFPSTNRRFLPSASIASKFHNCVNMEWVVPLSSITAGASNNFKVQFTPTVTNTEVTWVSLLIIGG